MNLKGLPQPYTTMLVRHAIIGFGFFNENRAAQYGLKTYCDHF